MADYFRRSVNQGDENSAAVKLERRRLGLLTSSRPRPAVGTAEGYAHEWISVQRHSTIPDGVSPTNEKIRPFVRDDSRSDVGSEKELQFDGM
jgi:hypothetical protein